MARHKIEVLHRHCADAGRDPAEVQVTWMAPVLLTESAEQTEATRDMVRSSADEETVAGFLIGQPDELPDLVAPYVEAGVDEVIVSLPYGSPDDIRRVGDVLTSAF